jgi:hypothetical protein
MVQPFIEFEKKYIPGLRQQNKIYGVTQIYHRGADLFMPDKKSMLITLYDDKATADTHLGSLRDDKDASRLCLGILEDFEKLLAMLQPSSPYKLYWSVVKDAKQLERKLNSTYADNMRRYIERKTTWRIGGKETIEPTFEVTFGELFVNLKWGSQRQRIKFEEIENS